MAELVWSLGTGTQAGHFVRSHENILVYFKDKIKVANFSGGKGVIEHSALKKISVKNPESEFNFPAGTRWDAPDNFELSGTWGGSEKVTLVKGRMIAKNGKLVYPETFAKYPSPSFHPTAEAQTQASGCFLFPISLFFSPDTP